MAKPSFGNGASFPVIDVADGITNLPRSYVDANERLQASLKQQLKQGSFIARHPVASNVLFGLAGAGLGAFAGANDPNGNNHPFLQAASLGLALPVLANASEKQRKSALIDKYNEVNKNLLEEQSKLDGIAQPRNDAVGLQMLLDKAKEQGLIPNGGNGIPDLYPRSLPPLDGSAAPAQPDIPIYSKEFLEAVRKGAFGGSDINYAQNLARENTSQFYGVPSGRMGTSSTPGSVGPNGLQGGVTQENTAQPNIPAPFFVSDPQSIMNNLQQVQSSALAQGQKRYEFDQEAPKRAAEVQKLMIDAQKAASEGRAADALALLREAQRRTEQQRPALIRAEANQANARASLSNRTDPNLRAQRAPNVIDLMTPQQRAQYAASTATGKQNVYSPAEAALEFKLQTLVQSDKDEQGNPISPSAKEAARQVLSKLQGNRQTANVPGRPTGPRIPSFREAMMGEKKRPATQQAQEYLKRKFGI